jgi:hypothetical protein
MTAPVCTHRLVFVLACQWKHDSSLQFRMAVLAFWCAVATFGAFGFWVAVQRMP